MVTLTTKIFDESEDFINSLTFGSSKKVKIICPDCGKQREKVFAAVIKAGHTYCDSCSKIQRKSMWMIGKSFGRLTVLSRGNDQVCKNGNIRVVFNCLCTCGKYVSVRSDHLKNGAITSCGCFFIERQSGANNHFYNPNLTDEERSQSRRRPGQDTWSKRVRRRDNYTCCVCQSTENVIAHHLNSYKENEELRYDINNGITMCTSCHLDFHKNFMGSYKTPCTAEDFEQYLLQV